MSCKNHAKTMQNAARTSANPPNPHSPRVPCCMCYMAISHTEHPLFPGSLLYVLYVLSHKAKPLNRRQEKHKEALAEKADQAMTPPLRFSCESLHDTRPGQGAGATAGPSRGRTGKVQRPAGEDRALHHCLRRRRPQAPCARDQRRFVAEFAGRAGEGTLVVWFSTGCRGLNFWAGHQREGQGDQAAQGSFTGFALCGLAFPFWARSWRARTNISRGSNQIEKVQEPTEKALHPRLLQSHTLHVFSLTGKESPQTREGEVIALRGLVFFSHSTPV